jgi:hypothetical protein
MQYNILDSEIYIISLNSKSTKCQNIVLELTNEGVNPERIKFVDGVIHENSRQGVALAHAKALNKALNELDEKTKVLILEEDAVINRKNKFKTTFTVPDYAGMIYLGWCNSSYEQEKPKWNIPNVFPFTVDKADRKIYKTETDMFRIHDLLAAHSIAYLNKMCMLMAVEAIQECINNNMSPAQDMSRAILQRTVPTYAPEFTQFVQFDDRLGKEYINEGMVDSIYGVSHLFDIEK